MPRDFNAELKKQLRLLEPSCNAYDAGDHDEAVRIATQLAIIVYDSGKNHSVVSLPGVKGRIRLLSPRHARRTPLSAT
jgi:hypothetical protein